MSLFYDFKEDSSGIAILTTTFLSAIALYFSSEKPKADNLTNLDLLFTYFYVFNGIALILNFYEFISNSSINSSTMIITRKLVGTNKFKRVGLLEDYLFKCDILKNNHLAQKINQN